MHTCASLLPQWLMRMAPELAPNAGFDRQVAQMTPLRLHGAKVYCLGGQEGDLLADVRIAAGLGKNAETQAVAIRHFFPELEDGRVAVDARTRDWLVDGGEIFAVQRFLQGERFFVQVEQHPDAFLESR